MARMPRLGQKVAGQHMAFENEALRNDPDTSDWHIMPKLHMFQHISEAPYPPKDYWCYRDETVGGELACLFWRKSGKNNPGTNAANCLLRWQQENHFPAIPLDWRNQMELHCLACTRPTSIPFSVSLHFLTHHTAWLIGKKQGLQLWQPHFIPKAAHFGSSILIFSSSSILELPAQFWKLNFGSSILELQLLFWSWQLQNGASWSPRVSTYLSIYPSIHLSLSTYLSIYLSFFLSIDILIYLSIHIHLSIDRSIAVSVYLSIDLSIYFGAPIEL